uniref:ORF41 n=1 Tax=Nitrosopumilaceae spindle-shaped virus TaxID=3065433 RepID=A0AAT9JGS7_9VIRU
MTKSSNGKVESFLPFNKWRFTNQEGNTKYFEIRKIQKEYWLCDENGRLAQGFKSLKYLHSLLRRSMFQMVVAN